MIHSSRHLMKVFATSSAKFSASAASSIPAQKIVVQTPKFTPKLASSSIPSYIDFPYQRYFELKDSEESYMASIKTYADQVQTIELVQGELVTDEPVFECKSKKAARARMKRIRRKTGGKISVRW